MWVWVGPRWLRPGGRGAKAMWVASLAVAAAMIVIAWLTVGRRAHGGTTAFVALWIAAVVAIEAWNFRTLYLGRGRRARAIQQALDASVTRH